MIARIWNALLKAAPLRLWVLFGAGPIVTIGTAVLVGVVWKGDMTSAPVELAGKRLDFIGWALLILLANFSVIIVTLAAVRVKGSGPGGVGLEIGGDGHSEKSE